MVKRTISSDLMSVQLFACNGFQDHDTDGSEWELMAAAAAAREAAAAALAEPPPGQDKPSEVRISTKRRIEQY